MVHAAPWDALAGRAGAGASPEQAAPLSRVAQAENEIVVGVSQRSPREQRRERMNRLAGFGVGLGCLFAQQVACHPFVVLRHQCQAHRFATGLSPVQCLRVLGQVSASQGAGALWRGLGSDMLGVAAMLGTQGAIAARKEQLLVRWRLEGRMRAVASVAYDVFAKGVGLAVALPLVSYSMLSMAMSRVAADPLRRSPAALVALSRPLFHRDGSRLSYADLFLPTALLCVAQSAIFGVVHRAIVRRYAADKGRGKESEGDAAPEPTASRVFFAEVLASFAGSTVAQVLLHPLETCVVRLHVQGTRALIDDPATGHGLLSVSTDFAGLDECWRESLWHGWGSLYAGAGAVVAQVVVQAVIVKASHAVFVRLQRHLTPKSSPE